MDKRTTALLAVLLAAACLVALWALIKTLLDWWETWLDLKTARWVEKTKREYKAAQTTPETKDGEKAKQKSLVLLKSNSEKQNSD